MEHYCQLRLLHVLCNRALCTMHYTYVICSMLVCFYAYQVFFALSRDSRAHFNSQSNLAPGSVPTTVRTRRISKWPYRVWNFEKLISENCNTNRNWVGGLSPIFYREYAKIGRRKRANMWQNPFYEQHSELWPSPILGEASQGPGLASHGSGFRIFENLF